MLGTVSKCIFNEFPWANNTKCIFISMPKIDSICTDTSVAISVSGLLVYIIVRSFHQVNISEIGSSQTFRIEFGSLSTTVLVFQPLFLVSNFKYSRETRGRETKRLGQKPLFYLAGKVQQNGVVTEICFNQRSLRWPHRSKIKWKFPSRKSVWKASVTL